MVTFCPLTEAKVRAYYQTTCTSFSSGGGRQVEERENPEWRFSVV